MAPKKKPTSSRKSPAKKRPAKERADRPPRRPAVGEARSGRSAPARLLDLRRRKPRKSSGKKPGRPVADPIPAIPLDVRGSVHPVGPSWAFRNAHQGLGVAPEVIIHPGDVRLQVFDTTRRPFCSICLLTIEVTGALTLQGTGWLVSKGTVITAGHCVFVHDVQDANGVVLSVNAWPRSITVIPGCNGGAAPFGYQVVKPTGGAFRTTDGWLAGYASNDYGAILLPEPFDAGYFGMAEVSDDQLLAAQLTISGYPGEADLQPPLTQWYQTRGLTHVTADTLVYTTPTTPGQSGSPVYYEQGGDFFAVGIHNYGDLSGNSATKISGDVYTLIDKWRRLGGGQ